jgi:hypothetical protein
VLGVHGDHHVAELESFKDTRAAAGADEPVRAVRILVDPIRPGCSASCR